MKNFLYFLLLLGLSSGWVQCRSDDSFSGTVSVSVEDETLVITNLYGQPVSYFAVESGTAELINWAGSSGEENTIADGRTKIIDWSDIYSDEPLRPGDRVIVYWWPAQSGTVNPAAMNQRVVIL